MKINRTCSEAIFYLRKSRIEFLDLKKILFLTIQLPFPPKSGGTVKSWNYVSHLSKSNQLTIGTLLKDDDHLHEANFQRNIKLDNYFSESVSISRSPINLLKSYLTAPSLNVFRNKSTLFFANVIEAAKKAEVIILDHYEVFQYVPTEFEGKVVMHTHNAEFMLWQRMSELTNNPIKKLILKLEAIRVKKYERLVFNQSDLIYSTPSDIELYKKEGFNTSKHQITYHLGNDHLLELPDIQFEETELAITFIGTLSWEPNINGICWFIDNCWSTIKAKQPATKLYILGKNPEKRILKSANKDQSIIFTGFVQDLDEYLQKTRVYIAPLRFGSGMKVKVLEGLYRGIPCVTTSVGAEGLMIRNEKEVFITDDAEHFSKNCTLLLETKTIWTEMRNNARKVAQKEYKWIDLFQKMDKTFEKLF